MKRIITLLLWMTLSCCQTMDMRSSTVIRHNYYSSVFVIGTNHILTDDMKHWGSAFLVDSSGTIVTTNHVVKDLLTVNQARRTKQPADAAYICVTVLQRGPQGNRSWTFPVDVVMQREDKDIAILRPSQSSWGAIGPPQWQPLEIDSRKELPYGEPVIVVERPFSPRDIHGGAFSEKIHPMVTAATVSGYSEAPNRGATQTSYTYENIKQVFLLLDHSSARGNNGGPVISKTTGKLWACKLELMPLDTLWPSRLLT
jgi:S1-C subfamily serine protease